MKDPDLTVDPAQLDAQLPADQAEKLRRADAHLAEVLDDFAHEPDAFDRAWSAATDAPTHAPNRRWTMLATALTALAAAASLTLVANPPIDATTTRAPAADACTLDRLEPLAMEGKLTKADEACVDRLVDGGTLTPVNAQRLRLVDLWSKGDEAAWLKAAESLALSDDADLDLAYKLIVRDDALDSPENVIRYAHVILAQADVWPDDVRGNRIRFAHSRRMLAAKALLQLRPDDDELRAIHEESSDFLDNLD